MANNFNPGASDEELMVCMYCGKCVPIRSKFCTSCGKVLNQDYLFNNQSNSNNGFQPQREETSNRFGAQNNQPRPQPQNQQFNPQNNQPRPQPQNQQFNSQNNGNFGQFNIPSLQQQVNSQKQSKSQRPHNAGFTQMNNAMQPNSQSASDGMTTCPVCHGKIRQNSNFCSICGFVLNNPTRYNQVPPSGVPSNAMQSLISRFGGGDVQLSLKDLFSEVFHKHEKVEKDELFIYGTEHTTPLESQMSSTWPKPWLYSRVFALFAIVFGSLYILARVFGNEIALPGLMFIGALAVPFATIIFFFEVNAPRNISIFDTVKIFFVGGMISLIATMIIATVFPSGDLDYTGATIVGITEEIAKLVPIIIYVKKRDSKYILNGLLIGAAVGGGFAVFETAGYAFSALWEDKSMTSMMITIFLRGYLAIGGHVIWAAIEGAALCAVKQDKPFEFKMLFNIRFLAYFIIPVILHSLWDCPLGGNFIVFDFVFLFQIGLTIIAWAVALLLISKGLNQISEISKNSKQ